MAWLQLILDTDASQAEALAEQLETLDALSVTLQDAADQPLYEPVLNTMPVWRHTQVIGLFEADCDPQTVLAELSRRIETLPPYRLVPLEDQDWLRACMADFKPMRFGERVWICPSWENPPQADAVNIRLDPGLAFGTGTHPTTALCLQWLDAHAEQIADSRVIDYGCGSGVLAIAALKLGAAAAWGIDNDPQALLASKDNAERNHVAEHLQLALPQDEPSALQADIVIANILANPLCHLAEHLARLTHSGGHIVLSGILAEQAQQVADTYAAWFHDLQTTEVEGWVRISGQRLG